MTLPAGHDYFQQLSRVCSSLSIPEPQTHHFKSSLNENRSQFPLGPAPSRDLPGLGDLWICTLPCSPWGCIIGRHQASIHKSLSLIPYVASPRSLGQHPRLDGNFMLSQHIMSLQDLPRQAHQRHQCRSTHGRVHFQQNLYLRTQGHACGTTEAVLTVHPLFYRQGSFFALQRYYSHAFLDDLLAASSTCVAMRSRITLLGIWTSLLTRSSLQVSMLRKADKF